MNKAFAVVAKFRLFYSPRCQSYLRAHREWWDNFLITSSLGGAANIFKWCPRSLQLSKKNEVVLWPGRKAVNVETRGRWNYRRGKGRCLNETRGKADHKIWYCVLFVHAVGPWVGLVNGADWYPWQRNFRGYPPPQRKKQKQTKTKTKTKTVRPREPLDKNEIVHGDW